MSKKMKPRAYKTLLPAIIACMGINTACFAQSVSISVNTQPSVSVKTTVTEKDVQVQLDGFEKTLTDGLKDLGKNLSLSINNIAPKLSLQLSNLANNISIDVNPDVNISSSGSGWSYSSSGSSNDNADDGQNGTQKVKNYSKSYPIDGNDQIKLSNQYGKITVNTWDRHEVKVDIEIKAEAASDDDAQKLLDGVQINDGKSGDVVSFKTEIGHNNSSWSLFNMSRSKVRKLTINYTVYMPAKTDLSVDESYGSMELPNLSGKVKISSSYGSVSAQNLSNPANEIDGSYGSLNAVSINGARLDFSYGSVNIEECNNLKADLSYGSFKLGRLKGGADMDLSYVGGFKIDQLANSFKKLNISSSYSTVSLGVPGTNNFDFDITTTYGGFNFSDDKVTITSKTPADGSKHPGPTKNFKGHFGKEGSESQVSIHSTYGGVNFD
jgi:hypothetical protein